MSIKPLLRGTKIVGNFARDAEAQAAFKTLVPNVILTLVKEPENPHDPFAVKVCTGGIHLGYLPREVSATIHSVKHPERLVCLHHGKGVVSVGYDSPDE